MLILRRKLTRYFSVFCVLSLLLSAVDAQSKNGEAKYSLIVETDRKNAEYKTGEEAVFRISVQSSDKQVVSQGTLQFVCDDFLNTTDLPSGKPSLNENPVRVTAGLKQPGFLRCTVTYTPPEGKPVRATAGAAFSPEKIGLSLPVPDDFDAFWKEQKRLLAEIPLKPVLTPVAHAEESIECWDLQTPCLGGAPVSGYFSKPRDSKAGSLPAILWVHGAGVRSSSLAAAATGAKAGMLSLDINAHGIQNGKPGQFYSDLSAGRLRNYRHVGRDSRETVYFRGMFLRLVRAIDFLTAQPEWNGEHVIVIGHSQGGGQSLVAGGIDDRVTMIAPGVPAICDHSGRAAGRINGWPAIVPNGSDGLPDAKILEATRYVDAVNFASRCKAEAIMSVGFIDAVCPPSSCYAAYNVLKGPKQIINAPRMGHAAPTEIKEAFFAQVLKHVGR